MCLGMPARIVAVGDDESVATVELADTQRAVNVQLLPERPAVGDWVLVHLGFAVETLDADDAAATVALLHELERSTAYDVANGEGGPN